MGKDHGGHVGRFPVDVLYRHLALAVGAEEGEGAVLAGLGRHFHDPVRKADGRRHQARGLRAGVAEHHALVTGPHFMVKPRAVHALRNVGRLALDGGDDRAGFVVDSIGSIRVPDGLQDSAHDYGQVDVPVGGDFSAHHDQAGGGEALACNAGCGILAKRFIEHRVRDLVAHLIRVPFPDAFRRENIVFSLAHETPSGWEWCLKTQVGYGSRS